jgi:hypothetical protein
MALPEPHQGDLPMNTEILSKFDIPTTGKTAAINFLRQNAPVAEGFASEFGFVNADPRITLKAAQLAAVAVFEEEADVPAYVNPRLETYVTYLNGGKTAPVVEPATVTTVEATTEETAPVVEPATVTTVEATTEETAPVVEPATVTTVEATTEETAPVVEPIAPAPKRRGRPPLDPSQRKSKVYVPTGRPRGRPKAADGTTGYDRALVWARTNGYVGRTDSPALRSELAMAIASNVDIPVGSALAYISRMFKANALAETPGAETE